MGSQETEDHVSVLSIDFAFGEERELRVKMLLDISFDIGIGSIFLIQELIAREGQYFKAFSRQFVIHGSKGLVVKPGESSVTGNVDHENGLFPSISREINKVSSDIGVFQVEERLGDRPSEQLIVLVRECECYSAHYDPAKQLQNYHYKLARILPHVQLVNHP